MADLALQYALNIECDAVKLSEQTLERHRRIFSKDDLSKLPFERVTETLSKELDLDITTQRLDSTHVFSNMAVRRRRRLFFKLIVNFLNQIRRRANNRRHALDADFRKRCGHNAGRILPPTAR